MHGHATASGPVIFWLLFFIVAGPGVWAGTRRPPRRRR